ARRDRRGGSAARSDRARARGAPPPGGRGDEQGHRRRTRPQRADRGPPRQQHLRKARRLLPRRGHRLRARARARLRLSGRNHPSDGGPEVGWFSRCGGAHPHRTVAGMTIAYENQTVESRELLLAGIPVRERRVDAAGIPTALLETGDGPPLVLLHEVGAFAPQWLRVLPSLARTHRVIAPDLPGHGETGLGEEELDGTRV